MQPRHLLKEMAAIIRETFPREIALQLQAIKGAAANIGARQLLGQAQECEQAAPPPGEAAGNIRQAFGDLRLEIAQRFARWDES